MSTKITYLLGAGASANAVPVVRNFSEMIDIMVDRLEKYAKNKEHIDLSSDIEESINKNKKFVLEMIEQFKNLSHKNKEFGTIDTYAKYLFVTGEIDKLKTLKRYISIYYVLQQKYFYLYTTTQSYQQLDSRYLTFLISIMDKNEFPEDIKILSWNYDFQLQRSSYMFRKEQYTFTKTRNGGTKYDKTHPLFYYWPPLGNRVGDISLYHLNGIAGFLDMKDYNNRDSIFNQINRSPQKENDIFNLLNDYFNDDYEPILNFAWEKKELFEDITNNPIKNDLINHIKDSEIMVIIGYSFPFFNRNIDKQIFDYFQNNRYKRIYYQSKDEKLIDKYNNLYQKFGLDKQYIKIEPYDDVSNFFIPHQF